MVWPSTWTTFLENDFIIFGQKLFNLFYQNRDAGEQMKFRFCILINDRCPGFSEQYKWTNVTRTQKLQEICTAFGQRTVGKRKFQHEWRHPFLHMMVFFSRSSLCTTHLIYTKSNLFYWRRVWFITRISITAKREWISFFLQVIFRRFWATRHSINFDRNWRIWVKQNHLFRVGRRQKLKFFWQAWALPSTG